MASQSIDNAGNGNHLDRHASLQVTNTTTPTPVHKPRSTVNHLDKRSRNVLKNSNNNELESCFCPRIGDLTEFKEVYKFLQSVDMLQYYSRFMQNGYDSLTSVRLLDKAACTKMKIPIGHAAELIYSVNQKYGLLGLETSSESSSEEDDKRNRKRKRKRRKKKKKHKKSKKKHKKKKHKKEEVAVEEEEEDEEDEAKQRTKKGKEAKKEKKVKQKGKAEDKEAK
eukprot:216059_1